MSGNDLEDLPNLTKLMYDNIFDDMLFEIDKIHQRNRLKIHDSKLVLNKLIKNNRFKDKINAFLENSSELERILFDNILLDRELSSGIDMLDGDMLDYEDMDDGEPDEFENVAKLFLAGEEPLDLTPEKIKYEDKKISKVFLDDYKTLVCDLDLPSEILGMYEVGQYIYHPNYLFASTHEKLCKTNCRFKIYSS